jgi:hypothetical protein
MAPPKKKRTCSWISSELYISLFHGPEHKWSFFFGGARWFAAR